MKAYELLNNTLNYWPNEINISDSLVIHENDGFICNNLILSWDNAAQNSEGNDWEELAAWVVYVLLHITAKEHFIKGIYKIYPTQISLIDFKFYLLENLQYDDYKSMLLEYHENN